MNREFILINPLLKSSRPTGISRVGASLIFCNDDPAAHVIYLNRKGELRNLRTNEILDEIKELSLGERTVKENISNITQKLRKQGLKLPTTLLKLILFFWEYVKFLKNDLRINNEVTQLINQPTYILITEPVHSYWNLQSIKKLKSKNHQIRIISICHDMINFDNPEWFSGIAKSRLTVITKFYELSDIIICVSEETAKQFKSNFSKNPLMTRKKLKVIKLGNLITPNKSYYSRKIPKKSDTKRILYVSSLQPRKNHVRLIDVLSKIVNENRKIELTLIAGDAWLDRKIQEKIDQARSINLQIRVLQKISENELIQEYNNCDFTCYLSLEEGFGLPVLESLSMGKVVVTSNVSSMNEFANLPGVIAINPEDESQIQNTFINLIDNETYLKKVTSNVDRNSIRSISQFNQELWSYVKSL